MKRFFKFLYGLFFVGLLTLFGCQADELQSFSTSNNESNFVEEKEALEIAGDFLAVSYTHLTLPTTARRCRSRWSPYH